MAQLVRDGRGELLVIEQVDESAAQLDSTIRPGPGPDLFSCRQAESDLPAARRWNGGFEPLEPGHALCITEASRSSPGSGAARGGKKRDEEEGSSGHDRHSKPGASMRPSKSKGRAFFGAYFVGGQLIS